LVITTLGSLGAMILVDLLVGRFTPLVLGATVAIPVVSGLVTIAVWLLLGDSLRRQGWRW
jgi:hypothetical protein